MSYDGPNPLPLPAGGTGASTLTGVVTGNGTSALTANAITQYGTVIAGASNAVSSVAPSATSGVPYISQGAASNPTFGTAVVAGGGTGGTTYTAYSVITAGTTATGAFQNVIGVGTSGQVLTSAGASALPSWQSPSAGGIVTLDGDSGSATGSTVTIAGAGGITTSASGSTVTITGGSGTTATVQTLNGTPTTLATIATSSNSVTTVNGYIAAAYSDYSKGCGGRINITYLNVSGTLTQISSTILDLNNSIVSGTPITVTVSGANILIQVTGVAATTINWKINYTTVVD